MYNLLRILGVYKYSITFWFLLFSSVLLLLNNNSFLKSYYFNSSNMIAGKVLSSRNSIINYFNLKSKNHQLLDGHFVPMSIYESGFYFQDNVKNRTSLCSSCHIK